MKHQLLKKISNIHWAKCRKSSDYNEARNSYIKLTELAEKIRNMKENENDKSTIDSEIEFWRNSIPIVNENEI